MVTAYLLAHANPHGDHFYDQRREPILAVVVHVTAGLEDLDGAADTSAEATARYAATTDRAVSWHSGSDTDSSLQLLPDAAVAFHCQGYNSCTYGHEISKRTAVWAGMPEAWVTATLERAADHLGPVAARHRIPLRHATRAELDAARAHWKTTGQARPVGFVAHADLDPDRRTDPGRDFPWARFLALMTTTEEDDLMALSDETRAQLRSDAYNAVWVYPRWTVPGTQRQENPGQFLAATRVEAVRSATTAAQALAVARVAAAGAGITDEQIERIAQQTADETARRLADGVQLDVTLTAKEPR